MENQKNEKGGTDLTGPQTERPIIIVESWLKAGFFFVLVLALGFLAVNQGLGFFYKAQLLKQPCKICMDLNPEIEECILDLNSARPSFWTPDGWTDPFNTSSPYNINISEYYD